MASRSAPPCTHELRPGIAVCLRCQHAERAAQLSKQRQMIVRGTGVALGVAVIAAVGIAATSALRSRPVVGKGAELPSSGESTAGIVLATSATEPLAADSEAPVPSTRSAVNDSIARLGAANAIVPVATPAALSVASPPATPPAMKPTAAISATRAVAPLVPVGRTSLRDTMVVDRAGDTVRVSFDLALSRTRRSDKFEAIVRSTLPQVYGAPADSALRALPAGVVARAGDLVTTLSERGFRIPLADGGTIAVWPETRAGRDGPLVVAYRAVGMR